MSRWRVVLYVAAVLAAYIAVGSVEVAVDRAAHQDDVRHAAR